MNLKTVTYDADQWQIVPKVATIEHETKVNNELCNEYGLSFIADTKHFARDAYRQWLVNAPQPPNLSPWLPIDDFLSSETFGAVWVKTKDDIRLCNHKVSGMFVGVLTGMVFTKQEVTHVILLERPQPPEVE